MDTDNPTTGAASAPAHLTLWSGDLLSKWGFSDGDVLWDLLCDMDTEGVITIKAFDRNDALVRLVEEHLLPALDQQVTTARFGTHNPIRAETVDGEDTQDRWRDPALAVGVLTPDRVDVPLATVREIVLRAAQSTPSGLNNK